MISLLSELQGKSLKSTVMRGGMVSIVIEYLYKTREIVGIEEK